VPRAEAGVTLSAREVRWAAGGRMIVDGVTIRAAPGRLLGLLGPNGSGKSSLLRLLAGLRRPATGVVTLDEQDMAGLRRGDVARRVAVVEQQAGTDAPVSVLDVVRLGRTPHRGPLSGWAAADEAAVEAALRRTGLEALRHQRWHTLSGGERQRAQIARALAQDPRELLLDEPTNHLDIRHQLELLALLRDLPVTAIVALHDLNLAAMFCDQLALLRDGRVVAAGSPAEVLTAGRIREVFGVAAQVGPAPHGGLQVQFLPPGG
jgi:iron complex transport system ATP-binding protein